MLYMNGKRMAGIKFIGGTGITDQDYNPESANAQSGKAVAQAVTAVEYINLTTEGFWVDGYIRSDSTAYPGTFANHSDYKRTGLLIISEYAVEEMNLIGKNSIFSVAYYKSDETYISGSGISGTITELSEPPDGAYYMAFSYDANQKNNILRLKHSYSKINDIAKKADANEQAIAEVNQRLTDTEQTIQKLQLELKIDGGYTRIFRTIGVIGDSLSSGEMTYDTGNVNENGKPDYDNVDMYEYSWLQYMARNCGSTGFNFSQGGLSTRTFLQDEGGHATACYTDASKKCQAYFIALGHNDYNQRNGTADLPPLPIGTISDIHTDEETNKPDDYTQNADSYYGNYATIIQKLLEKFPKAKIFAITMKDDAPWYTYKDYSQAVRDVVKLFNNAGHNNVYLLDMEQHFSYRPEEHFTNGHGNAMGYYQYSLEIQTLVDKAVRENIGDFMYVQFINTEFEQYIPN